MLKFIPIAILISIFGCSQKEQSLNSVWRAELYHQSDTLPFNFRIDEKSRKLWLFNGDEELQIDDIRRIDDSLIVDLHIFDTQLRAAIEGDQLKGIFIKNYSEGYILPFSAQKNVEFRFSQNPKTEFNISGKWKVYFESDLEDSVYSVGEFQQRGSKVTGTFLTITGDYRYLEGEMNGNQLSLSCFDGEHAFLFKAELDELGNLGGYFKSGKTWNEKWTATRNDTIELPDPHSLTYLKEGYEGISFSFPKLNGDTLSFPDPDFENKVVLIQIFGTWCPNCMDETVFLSDWYNQNKSRNVEILALAFERKNDLQYARERIERVQEKLGAEYTFLFAGPSDKQYASEALPMLNKIISFPTLIIIDRKGVVRKIHTGFSGPGTGVHYENFKSNFETFMNSLMTEK